MSRIARQVTAHHLDQVIITRTSWRIEVGGLRIARTRWSERPASMNETPRGSTSWLPTVVPVGTLLVLLCASALPAASRVQSRSAIDLPVPPPVRLSKIDGHRATPRRHRPAIAANMDGRPATTPEEEPGALAATMTKADAIAAAFRLGEPQDWAEGDAHGLIVPGPLQPDGPVLCRAFSAFIRRSGSSDTVEQSKRCSADGQRPSVEPG